MKFKRPSAGAPQGDLTPMIDMTFQLIAFFMVLINFTEADTNERIKLPTSEIVKPPDGQFLNLRMVMLSLSGSTAIIPEGPQSPALSAFEVRSPVSGENRWSCGPEFQSSSASRQDFADAD